MTTNEGDALTTDLLSNLHEVAQAIAYVEKAGHNDHHHYNFVQAVDVVRTVREELLKRNIIVIPGATHAEHLAYGSKGAHLTTLTLHYRFTDVQSGSIIEVPWIGVGADTGGDKGVYKAYTGGLKYALLSLFLIPTTDDPERDQLTSTPPAVERDPAPVIPLDRAKTILQAAFNVGMASLDADAAPGTPPVFHPVFKAQLALVGVDKIGLLNVDQAEAVEAFLRGEGEGA